MASKVLLVEDDNNLREIYEARLQAEGYNIISAKDGEEALVIAKAEIPDLIISDVMMPKISGFEMLDILRNTDGLKETKVIMLTALGQSEDKLRANSLGANRYLVKSQVTLEDIVKAAHELLDDVTAPSTTEPQQPMAAPVAAAPAVAAASVPQATAPTLTPVTTPATTTVATPVAAPTQTTPDTVQTAVSSAPEIAPVAPTTVPISTLPPEPVQAPAEPAMAAVATPPLDTSTTAQEQATMQAQIEKFVEEPTPATPETPTASVDPTAITDDASNAAVMDSALKSLSSNETPATPEATESSPSSIVQPEPKEPELDSFGNTKVVIANKKTIEPLDSVEKPNINDLLAAEEAKSKLGTDAVTNTGSPSSATAPAAVPSPTAAPTPQPPVTPGGVDPNDIAL